jgi:hypothetical protein
VVRPAAGEGLLVDGLPVHGEHVFGAIPRVTTYAASRSLKVDPPAADGTVVLDFDRATNLPCARVHRVRDLPAAPGENHLPVAVEAGEQKPVG